MSPDTLSCTDTCKLNVPLLNTCPLSDGSPIESREDVSAGIPFYCDGPAYREDNTTDTWAYMGA
jgi:hypothetical protein